MTTLVIQTEHFFPHITPLAQFGDIKGQQMLHHIWGGRSEWHSSPALAMASVHYLNIFPSLLHALILAF